MRRGRRRREEEIIRDFKIHGKESLTKLFETCCNGRRVSK
jgi:hypothetical protein